MRPRLNARNDRCGDNNIEKQTVTVPFSGERLLLNAEKLDGKTESARRRLRLKGLQKGA
jgi:hypothetical protein